MRDPIVEEVRRVRDAHAARFNYDLDDIFRDIKEQERKSGCTFVSFAPRKGGPKPEQQPTQDATATAQGSTSLHEAPAS
jgi:hypothetical protein